VRARASEGGKARRGSPPFPCWYLAARKARKASRAAEQVKPPTMTRIVTGLERSRLAEGFADPADARKVKIRATRKGVRLLQQNRQRRIEYLAQHLGGLNRQELGAPRQTADILQRSLNKSH
jgi:DNA-binding MarR family transcriptional regulator